MQDADLSIRDLFTPAAFIRRGLIVGGVVTVAAVWQIAHGGVLPSLVLHLHAPQWQLLSQAGAVIQIHLAAAVVALLVGAALLVRTKGTAWHKRLGWAWVMCMATVTFSSLFITVLNPGHWSFIHALSGYVLISLPIAVVAIRRGNVQLHRRTMTGIYIGGLLIAGLFTLAPGRLMFRVFFG